MVASVRTLPTDAQPYLGARSTPFTRRAGYMMVDGVFPLESLAMRPLGLSGLLAQEEAILPRGSGSISGAGRGKFDSSRGACFGAARTSSYRAFALASDRLAQGLLSKFTQGVVSPADQLARDRGTRDWTRASPGLQVIFMIG